MKYVKVIFFLVLLISIFNSCANLNDEWIELGDGYVCKLDGGTVSIYNKQTYYKTEIYSKITDYKFNEKFIIAKQNPDYEYYKNSVEQNYSIRYMIYDNYLKEKKSKQFIKETKPFIRKSIIADSSFYKLLKSKGVTAENQIDDRDKIKKMLDSVFHFDPFYKKVFSSKENYWIIDKDDNIRYGPFTKKEFEKELKQKKIDLKFE